jgi:hypothetical protein
MMSHTAARTVNVVADGLDEVHGETDESPMPLPRATRSNVIATAATPPAMTAAHDTADWKPEPPSATFIAGTAVSAASAIGVS